MPEIKMVARLYVGDGALKTVVGGLKEVYAFKN
jgi:hypothetical protein